MKKELDLFNLDKDYELEDLCDKKYISQVPSDELKKIALTHFFNKHSNYVPIAVDRETLYQYKEIKLADKYAGKNLLFYYVDSIDDDNWKKLPYVNIRYSLAEAPKYWTNGKMYAYANNNVKQYQLGFSNYTMQKPIWMFHYWDFDEDYFMHMFKKFGDGYCTEFLTKRKFFREYYLARENAKRDEAIRLMKENFPSAYPIKKLTKTTDTFIESTPVELVKIFFDHIAKGKPWIIDVTNFQTLKNEDIPEECKNDQGATLLRRIKSSKQNGAIKSILEYQWRIPKLFFNGKELVNGYPKKNEPVKKQTHIFKDFSYEINGLSYDSYKESYDWRAVMYSAFGEDYEQALKKTFDDKIKEYIDSYDKETLKIMAFIKKNCSANPRLSETM